MQIYCLDLKIEDKHFWTKKSLERLDSMFICCKRLLPLVYLSQFKKFRGEQQPWSSGYRMKLTIWSLWVQIPAPYVGWTWHIFTLICCKKLYGLLEKTENKRKRGRGWTIFEKNQGPAGFKLRRAQWKAGTLTMELFSRRRWRLISAQVVSCCVYENRKQ